jgi:hypothetical protein
LLALEVGAVRRPGALFLPEMSAFSGSGALCDERRFMQVRSGQGESAFRQQLRKSVAREEGVFLLAHGGEMVEALQFGVDEARVAHHHAALGQALEE